MKNLREIAQIVNSIRLKTTDLITIDQPNKTKARIFYEKLLAEDFSSDQEAAAFFFNSPPSHSNYKNLKRFLREKLISSLFFIPTNLAHSDYERAYLFCSKNLFAAKTMIHLGARSPGTTLTIKVFNKAMEYELTEFIIMSSKHLRLHYGSRMGDVEKFDYYDQIFKKYLRIWEAEALAEGFYATIMSHYVKSKAANDSIHEKAEHFYEELKPYLQQFSSPYLHFVAYYIRTLATMTINNYQATIDICEEGIKFFEAKPFTYKNPLSIFYHNLLICYTQLKNFERGNEVAGKAINLSRAGTHNWFINKELHMILALHSKRYAEAKVILEEVLEHYKFKSLVSHLKERWLINSAYISFLIFIKKIKVPDAQKEKFRLGKFLNSIPIFSKDKRGLNIPVLIIQILFFVVKKDYDQSIDRFDAIKKYLSRYLRQDDNFRSNCFINMLLQIPASNFHRAGVERRAKKYYDKLLTSPLEIAKQSHVIEIIPYEDLWEIVVDSLSPKFYYLRKKT